MASASVTGADSPERIAIESAEPIHPTVAVERRPILGLVAPDPGSSETSFDATKPIEVGAARVLNFPQQTDRRGGMPAAVLQPLQSWEGVVLEVRDKTFTVRLVDLTGDRPEEEMELEKEELSDFDLELLEPGAIFYWRVGYRRQLPRGARERVSLVRFRRLPAWSKAELASARQRAEDLASELGW
jgi:hypothetical protein